MPLWRVGGDWGATARSIAAAFAFLTSVVVLFLVPKSGWWLWLVVLAMAVVLGTAKRWRPWVIRAISAAALERERDRAVAELRDLKRGEPERLREARDAGVAEGKRELGVVRNEALLEGGRRVEGSYAAEAWSRLVPGVCYFDGDVVRLTATVEQPPWEVPPLGARYAVEDSMGTIKGLVEVAEDSDLSTLRLRWLSVLDARFLEGLSRRAAMTEPVPKGVKLRPATQADYAARTEDEEGTLDAP